jgi:ABC-type sugar transport system ATPase subunit
VTAEVPLLRASELTKSFGAVHAVEGASIDVWPGEVVGLIGENGAGKSTLIGMIGGLLRPDAGRLAILGEERSEWNPGVARRVGVAVVYQELSLCPNMTVAENMHLGDPTARFGVLDRRAMRRATRSVMSELGAAISPDTRIESLRIAEQQLVEIGRAVHQKLRVLILDEPTSSLSHEDFETLKRLLEQLKKSGVGIVFVSHRLTEVTALSDRIVVMRDGRVVSTAPGSDATVDGLSRLMVGRAQEEPLRRVAITEVHPSSPPTVLQLRAATRHGDFDSIDLHVSSGEIVGIAGLRGAGRHELAETVFGLRQLDGGEIWLSGVRLDRTSPARARALGVSYLPQDRRREGIVGVWDVRHNLALGNLSMSSRHGVISHSRLDAWARGVIRRFKVRPDNPTAPVLSLSGGNQQKVVLGRSLAAAPKLLLALEPTRGVDVGAKAEIRNILRRTADEGAGVLLVDSELSDLIVLCDRIYVMHRGRLAGVLTGDEATEERITYLAAGGFPADIAGSSPS